MPEPLLDAEALAAWLGWSPKAIYNRRARGDDLPPAIRLSGGAIRWDPGDVRSWLKARKEVTHEMRRAPQTGQAPRTRPRARGA